MNSDIAARVRYSADEVRVGEIPLCLMMIAPHDRIISRVAPKALELSLRSFSETQKREIEEHMHSYTEKILLTECEGRIWGFLPSVYPSATLCAAIATDESLLSGADLLRLAEEDGLRESFVLSESITTRPSRMSERLCEIKRRHESFFECLISAFSDISALEGSDVESAREELYERIYALSRLTGCPVESITENDREIGDYRETDLPLFVAFLFCFLAFARANADLRNLSIALDSSSSAAVVTLRFKAQKSVILSDELLEWEGLTSDRNMMFGYSTNDGITEIIFQPLRRDWSYLGLKQKISFFE